MSASTPNKATTRVARTRTPTRCSRRGEVDARRRALARTRRAGGAGCSWSRFARSCARPRSNGRSRASIRTSCAREGDAIKGIIFNLFEGFVSDGWGYQAYEDVLSSCTLSTTEPFVGPGSYPDGDLFALVRAAADEIEQPVGELLHGFGKYCFPKFAAKYPVFVRNHAHPKPFLMTVDDVVHIEVRKLFRDARPPRISAFDTGPDELLLSYVSQRKLCALFAGLIEGTAAHFGVGIAYEETQCMSRSDGACVFHLRFGAKE